MSKILGTCPEVCAQRSTSGVDLGTLNHALSLGSGQDISLIT